ncbi:UNVERIFIED_CONTAM: hypothetical protein GTU68_037701 [Idotea baltica]|nr:hypothetical protein [Idotea baltica]
MRRLINELSKLPSIGERSATRLAYHLVANGEANAKVLSDSIQQALTQTKLCKTCYFFSESEICDICSDSYREKNLLCVVEKPADVFALEKCGSYRGLYHVLHGVWSPLRGIKTEQTKVKELLSRIKSESDSSFATSTTIDGEATALFISRELEDRGLQISRIGQGMPKGGELEFADELTLAMSLQGRKSL